MQTSASILEKAKVWASSSYFDLQTRKEVQKLIETHNEKELSDRFYRDLEFGTGGMRGIMGAGTAYFNVYNVRRASHSLSLYLRSLYGNKNITLAISYDSRNHSRFFAESACEVFAAHKIACILTKNMRPVPMLSFMVRHYSCDAGICITASHNPAQYNGYKIYWKSGGQLCPPHDKNIFEFYKQTEDYSKIDYIPFTELNNSPLLEELEEELDQAYFSKLESLSLFQGKKDLKIVYSPLHGTGVHVLPHALSRMGFRDLILVEEQSTPDGNFPTVQSPNPEDSRALDLALKLGKAQKADLVLATDPDADRLAVVVREREEWKVFTGNQMGALFFNYRLSLLQKQNKLPQNGLTISTIVTTPLLREISKFYGVLCEETLTGFKWICDRIEDYESAKMKPYREFLCGAEESYGFLAGTFVRDKDAILSALVACEMLAYYKSLGQTLSQVLEDIYLKHGFYHEILETITLPGKEGSEKIQKTMEQLRKKPLVNFAGERILSMRDYLDIEKSDMSVKLKLPPSDVLEYNIEGGRVSIRPSGTEPKIKIYISVFEKTKDIHTSRITLEKKAYVLKETCLQLIQT